MNQPTVPRTSLFRTTCALALAVGATTAGASGFQIREQSAPALSNAMAGAAATAEDASALAYNPASIGRLAGTQAAGTLSYIDASFTLDDGEARTTAGVPISGDSDDGGTGKLVPAAAMKWRLSNRWDVGVGIHSAFGLATDYERGWIGRYHALESELLTVAFNPVVSFRASDRLTLGGGLIAQYADATLSSAVDFGSIGAARGVPGASPTAQDGFVEVTGDDWGYGVTLGLLYELTERTRAGLGFRSQVAHRLTGEADYEYDDAGVGRALSAGSGSFTDGADGAASVRTPAVVTAGLSHAVSDRWTLLGTVEWTRWSSFDELVVEFGDNTPDTRTVHNWENTWMASVGANYRVSDAWLVRGGLGYDESPVPDAGHRTPRIPDQDRRWAAVGATWQPTPRLSVTGSWVHIFIRDADLDQDATPTNENSARGSLAGNYDSSRADVVSLQASYRF